MQNQNSLLDSAIRAKTEILIVFANGNQMSVKVIGHDSFGILVSVGNSTRYIFKGQIEYIDF